MLVEKYSPEQGDKWLGKYFPGHICASGVLCLKLLMNDSSIHQLNRGWELLGCPRKLGSKVIGSMSCNRNIETISKPL